MKTPFITKEKAEEIIKQYPTPFHIYDEKGIRQRARDLYKAFSWNKGFKEYFTYINKNTYSSYHFNTD